MLHQHVDQDEDERSKDDEGHNEGGDGDRSKSNDDYCDLLFFFQKLWQKLPFFSHNLFYKGWNSVLTRPFFCLITAHFFHFAPHPAFALCVCVCVYVYVYVCVCVCVCVFMCVCVFQTMSIIFIVKCQGPQGGGSQVVPL